MQRQPDFDNLRRVLDRTCPNRPTLFEFFLNASLYEKLTGYAMPDAGTERCLHNRFLVDAFRAAGYDYATIHPPVNMEFKTNTIEQERSISQNEYNSIRDRRDFEKYQWPEPDRCDYSIYDRLAEDLPSGMKAVVCGPGGVLENVTRLVGYDTMCIMTFEDPELLADIFNRVGSILVRHYELAASFETVGALISNDDWGFNQQTMLSPADFEKYLFPWHRQIVKACHRAGKQVILHSCGNLAEVMDNIIDDIGYDGKHSYEDKIQAVEDAYEQYHQRIAILGGIDLDFVCRSTPEVISERSRRMLERAAGRGSYALGTGNSVPDYTPDENYFAMINPAFAPSDGVSTPNIRIKHEKQG